MQQSSKAQDQNLSTWFVQIGQGSIKLPRFQRHEAWDRGRITSFLNTVIYNLPVGVTLMLEVAGPEQFESRYIVTAEPKHPQPVTRHLLDGQQRLTAFWRAMHNNYAQETYFVYLPAFDQGSAPAEAEMGVRCIPRWLNRQGLRMPRWADDPAQCLQRGLIPISLLRPGDIKTEIETWVTEATRHLQPDDAAPDALAKFRAYVAQQKQIHEQITELRTLVAQFNLPYLSLPASTTKDVALKVFINMNTNSKPLALYDIIVAELENAAGQSLHVLQAKLDEQHPEIGRYGNLSNLVLSTSALLQEKLPNERGMVEMDKKQLLDNWPKLTRGLHRMSRFLAQEGVFDTARLPTNAVLAVIAAAYDHIPEHGDLAAKGERLLRRYLWSSFFTDRYENAAASRAFADFRALKALLLNPGFTEQELASVPVLNRAEFPLADADSLLAAGWPKGMGIRARAILAVTTLLGARDFADDQPASFESVQKREYHHVFPAALLAAAGLEKAGDLALNCALITWKTNRSIGRKDPLAYLQERVQWADEDIVRERLRTHLIDMKDLEKAQYGAASGSLLRARLEPEYQAFLQRRAGLIVAAMQALVDGRAPSLETLWAQPTAAGI
ncbi:hypothetical protein L1280_001940 [Deinococcus sp. HSC-46F16]|uniref:DUF262 domain-containing protein n=1 Tax=Deinococcus sp. HSC-46F16 TaxID=2910968 RepID=UPI00209F01CD|nr:DUF262 domain-containing protein [Deinococcus sp. HSC-46F16]MCP2014788.1 hypothetical protein [Deinococcus sp. HSC-46F16]